MKSLLLGCLAFVVPLTGHADRIDQALALLNAPVYKARVGACLALGTQKKQAARVVGPLTAALKDRHRAVRAACAMALGKLGAVEAVAALSEVMTDEDMTVARVARTSLQQVIRAFVKNRGRFEDRRFNLYVQGLTTDGTFKELVMERLLPYKNVAVGGGFDFDGAGDSQEAPAIGLDLSGEFSSEPSTRAQLKLTLSLRKGGYVITSWKRLSARGKTREEALKGLATQAVGRVLGYLGARRR